MNCMLGYALRLQCQLDKYIKVNGIAHRPETCQAVILSRRLGGSSESNEPPGSAMYAVRLRFDCCSTSNNSRTVVERR